MQYVTSIERLAIEEGIRESIVDVLTVRFGEVSNEIANRLNQVEDVDTLRSLRHQAITVDSLDAFVQLLPETSE